MVRLCAAKSGAHPREGRRGENGRHAVALHVLQYDMHSAAAVSITHRVSVLRCQSPNNPAKLLVAGSMGGEVHHILKGGFPQSKLVVVFVIVDHRN